MSGPLVLLAVTAAGLLVAALFGVVAHAIGITTNEARNDD